MRRKKRRVFVARYDVVSGPRIAVAWAFKTDPTIDGGVADCLGSSLVIAGVVRSVRLGMESVVGGLAVSASAWVDGEIAAGQTGSRDGHSGER